MKKLIFLIILLNTLSILMIAQSKTVNDECYICHESNEDEPAVLFKNDIHHQKGISCSGCHGGKSNSDDMDIAMDPKNGFIGVPKGDVISERCIICHNDSEKMKKYGSDLPTNQYENIKTSVHWKLNLSGNQHIVQCITCHNAHGIVSVKNPKSPVHPTNVPKTCSTCHSNASFMRNYNPSLPVDQMQKYLTSQHGILNAKGDKKVAECASCHGSHDIKSSKDVNSKVYPTNVPETCSNCHSDAEYMKSYNIATDQFAKYARSVHGIALIEKKDINAPACNSCHGNHGAMPPGVESISKVCGTCHALNADLFSNSPHKKAFDKNNYPECETCHNNHEILSPTIEMLGVTEEAVCSKCHKENENEKGYKVAMQMRELLENLEANEKEAGILVDEAEQKGMEISETKFKLRDIRQARLESRTMVHAFNLDKFKEVVKDKGIVTSNIVIEEAKASIDDFYFRRYGLFISIVVMSALAFGIFLYIKKIEKE